MVKHNSQGRLVRKTAVNANPGLKVNRSMDCTGTKMCFTGYVFEQLEITEDQN